MQKLVAGKISREHDIVEALKELLSMEDFSHGCLEIFAPTIKGLIGISDNREIVAAQISADGPTGLRALQMLLTVNSGRFAFREGYRVPGGHGLSFKKHDLDALIESYKSTTTESMPEANDNTDTFIHYEQAGSLGNQKIKKGLDAVARMKSAVQTRTGTNIPALQMSEIITYPEPAKPATADAQTADDYPAYGATPKFGQSEAVREDSTDFESVTAPAPVKPKISTWLDLLSDNNVSVGRARPINLNPESGTVSEADKPVPAETKTESSEPQTPVSPNESPSPTSSPAPSEGAGLASKFPPAKAGPLKSGQLPKDLPAAVKALRQTSTILPKLVPPASTGGVIGARVSNSTEIPPIAKNSPEPKQEADTKPISGSNLPRVPFKRSWAAEQLARKARVTRTGITGHDLPAMQGPNEKLTRSGEQPAITTTEEKSKAEIHASISEASAAASAPDQGKTSPDKAQSQKTALAPSVNAASNAIATTAESADSSLLSGNPRNTSNWLGAMKVKPENNEEREREKAAQRANDPRRTRTIQIYSAQVTEQKEKLRTRRNFKLLIGGIVAAAAIGCIICAGLAVDEQVKVTNINALYEKNDHKGAVALANEALKLHPKSAKLLDARGHSLGKLGHSQEALQDFENALSIRPNDLDILKHRAYAYLLTGKYQAALDDYNKLFQDKTYQRATLIRCRASAEMELGKFADANKDLAWADHLATPSNDELLTEAVCEARQGHYHKSEEKIKEILKRDPINAAAFLQQAANFVALKKRSEAKGTLHKLLAKHPVPEAYLRLAEIAHAEKNLPEELDNYSKYLSLNPHDQWALARHAQIYLAMGKPEQALSDYNNIEKSNDVSSSCDFYAQRAKIEMDLGSFTLAFNDLKKCSSLRPDDDWLNVKLAEAAEKSGNYNTAAEAYSRILAKDPHIYRILLKRGNAYMLFKKYQLANDDFDKAIQINPGNKEGYFKRGLNCFNQRLFDRAAVDFEQCLRIDPNYTEAKKLKLEIARLKGSHGDPAPEPQALSLKPPEIDLTASKSERELIKRGYEHFTQGQYSSAIKYFVQVLKLYPNSTEARKYLAFACVSDGRTKAALEQFGALNKMNALKDEDRAAFAEALCSSGKNKEAISVWLTLLSAHPENVDTRVKVAQAYVSLNDMVKFQNICKEGMKIAKSTKDYERLRALLIATLKNRAQEEQGDDAETMKRNRDSAAKISG